MNWFGKNTHATKAELESHQGANERQIESLNAVCVDTREIVKAMKDLLVVNLENIEHRLDCVESDIKCVKERVRVLECLERSRGAQR